eukprot:scaffold20662_cov66-Phaeocystis_antarctica.AAC.17
MPPMLIRYQLPTVEVPQRSKSTPPEALARNGASRLDAVQLDAVQLNVCDWKPASDEEDSRRPLEGQKLAPIAVCQSARVFELSH